MSMSRETSAHGLLFAMNGISHRMMRAGGGQASATSVSYTFITVVEGRCELQFNGVRLSMIRGRSCLLPPDSQVTIHNSGLSGLSFYSLEFDVYRVAERGTVVLAGPDIALRSVCGKELTLPFLDRLERELRELHLAEQDLESWETPAHQLRFQQLVHWIWERYATERRRKDAKTEVERTIAHILGHYHEVDLSVEKLARMAGISRRWYTALFKSLTGQSPNDYISELRMAAAKKLLHTTDDSLYTIARRAGFADEHYFSRRFRQAVGMSPRGYIRNRRYLGLSVTLPELLFVLGITPIAAPAYHTEFPKYISDSFAEVKKLRGRETTANLTEVKAANPDLVLVPEWLVQDERVRDELSSIATTIVLPNRLHWRDHLRDIAELLGKEKQAEQAIRLYESKVDEARETILRTFEDQGVIYMVITRQCFLVMGSDTPRGSVIHRELGLRAADNVPSGVSSIALSIEELERFNADFIFLQLDDESEEVRGKYVELLTSPVWKRMTFAKKNQVYRMGSKEWFNVGYSPLANQYAFDDILNSSFRMPHR